MGRNPMIWAAEIHEYKGRYYYFATHGMLFKTPDGKLLMSIHSHKDVNGRYIRVPHLFEVDLSGNKLKVGKPYVP